MNARNLVFIEDRVRLIKAAAQELRTDWSMKRPFSHRNFQEVSQAPLASTQSSTGNMHTASIWKSVTPQDSLRAFFMRVK